MLFIRWPNSSVPNDGRACASRVGDASGQQRNASLPDNSSYLNLPPSGSRSNWNVHVDDRLPGAVRRPDGVCLDGLRVRWIGRRHGDRQDRRWAVAWSPGRSRTGLRPASPDDDSVRISHEAICQALYVQGRRAP